MHTHKAVAGIGVALGLLTATGCGGGNCGDAKFTTGADALAAFDEDGDGTTADLREACGAATGSFGLRRADLGITTVVFDPSPLSNDLESALRLTDLLLPSSSVVFLTEHLEAGVTLDMDTLGGSGLHKLYGTPGDIYETFKLLDGTVEVLDGPRVSKGTVAELSNEEQWRLRWKLSFGDPQSGMVTQTWDAEDWVPVSDGTEVGTPADYPPDAVTSP